jgi:hypothetical protein
MMEAARTSETLVNFYQTTRCYNPEDSNLQNTRRIHDNDHLVDAAKGNNRCLFWALYESHKYTVRPKCSYWMLKQYMKAYVITALRLKNHCTIWAQIVCWPQAANSRDPTDCTCAVRVTSCMYNYGRIPAECGSLRWYAPARVRAA